MVADPASLGFLADASVDGVIADNGALSRHLMAEDIAAEISRVLRPGGQLLACVDSLVLGMSILAEQRHWAELTDLPQAEVVLVPWPDGRITRCFGPEQLTDLLGEAGLEVRWIRPRTVLSPSMVDHVLRRDPGAVARLVRAELAAGARRARPGPAARGTAPRGTAPGRPQRHGRQRVVRHLPHRCRAQARPLASAGGLPHAGQRLDELRAVVPHRVDVRRDRVRDQRTERTRGGRASSAIQVGRIVGGRIEPVLPAARLDHHRHPFVDPAQVVWCARGDDRGCPQPRALMVVGERGVAPQLVQAGERQHAAVGAVDEVRLLARALRLVRPLPLVVAVRGQQAPAPGERLPDGRAWCPPSRPGR